MRSICPYTAFTASHRYDHRVVLNDFSVSFRSSPFTSVSVNGMCRLGLASKKIAFDCLPHELLLAKLKSYGLSSDSLLLLRSYLTDCFQRVKIGDTFSDWTRITRSIPRSSEINTYADDTQFFTSDQDPVIIQLSKQANLQSASEWLQSNGMGW